MKNIVGAFPFELLLGEEMCEAGNGLVKVDQAEADVEIFDGTPAKIENADTPDNAEYYVKDIVGARAACQAFIGGYKKTKNADEDKERGEDKQDVVVQVFHERVFAGRAGAGSCSICLMFNSLMLRVLPKEPVSVEIMGKSYRPLKRAHYS